MIDQAKSAAAHVSRSKNREIRCQVALLYPSYDHELVNTFKSSDCLLIGGDEDDVLSRYIQAQETSGCDYLVRLTSDCPLMLDYVIVKHINVAAYNFVDYASNIEESCRTVADGFDCEVLSKRAMSWLKANAVTKEDKEHVTTAIRRVRPLSLKQAFVSMKIDTAHMKMSVDTPEDLERMRAYYEARENKKREAIRIFGASQIYEL